jgi:hypothetical protein
LLSSFSWQLEKTATTDRYKNPILRQDSKKKLNSLSRMDTEGAREGEKGAGDEVDRIDRGK